jgi:hypothetical protein
MTVSATTPRDLYDPKLGASVPDDGVFFLPPGQRFERIAQEPYVRADGKMSAVGTWRSLCARCGTPMTYKASADPVHARKKAIRRCKAHAKRRSRIKVLHPIAKAHGARP